MIPEDDLPGRPLTESERQSVEATGNLPEPVESTPEPEGQGFDLGQALQTGYQFLTENTDPAEEKTQEQRVQEGREKFDAQPQDATQQFLEENVFVPARDFIDNTFQGDQRSREEIAEDRTDARRETFAQGDAFKTATDDSNNLASEASRVVVGGVAQSVETILEGIDFAGDNLLTAGAAFGLPVEEKNLTWSEAYEAADYDLGVTENKTRLGAFARNTLGVLINMRQLAKYGGIKVGTGPNSTIASRMGGETLRGAIVDFFTSPDGGNLANIFGGDEENANIILKAIAHQDDDNQYTRRLKNAFEGGTIGLVADGAGELIGAFRKGFRAKGSPEQKTRVTIAEMRKRVGADDPEVAPQWQPEMIDTVLRGDYESAFSRPTPEGYDDALNAWKRLSFQDKVDIYENSIDAEQRLGMRRNMPIGYFTDFKLEKVTHRVDLPYGNEARFEFERMSDDTQATNVNWFLDSETTRRYKEDPNMQISLMPLRSEFRKLIKDGNFRVGTVLEAVGASDRSFKSIKGVDETGSSEARLRRKAQLKPFRNAEDVINHMDDAQYERIEKIAKKLAEDGGDVWDEMEFDSGPNSVAQDQLTLLKFAFDQTQPKSMAEVIRGEYEPNIRSRLYQRMGFSKPMSQGVQRAIVVQSKDGLSIKPLDVEYDPDNVAAYFEAVEALQAKARSEAAAIARDFDDVGAGARKSESNINGGSQGKLDPQERASRTSRFDVEDVEVTQREWTDPDGEPKPFMDDSDFRGLDTPEKLRDFIKMHAETIDVDEIARRLSREPLEYQIETLQTVAQYAYTGMPDHLIDKLTFDIGGPRVARVGGAVVLKVITHDAAMQMRSLAKELIDLEQIDANYNNQALMILERGKMLMRAKKEATQLSSDLLQQWGTKPRRQAYSNKELSELAANDAKIVEIFENWESMFRRGDIEEIRADADEFLEWTNSLLLSDGDPIRQVSLLEAYVKTGMRSINQVLINGWLSTPVSQMRNIAGNAFVAAERPAALAIGSLLGRDLHMAKGAAMMFDGFHETLWDSLRAAYQGLKTGEGVTTQGGKFDYKLDEAARIEALKAKAKTPLQRSAVAMLDIYHSFAHSPWITWPGRGLTAGDEFFKTLLVRQELRYQAFMEMDNFKVDGSDIADAGTARSELYKNLKLKYLGQNGEILNQRLMQVAEEGTFQTELEGTMAKIQDVTNDIPGLKQFMPFVKTPHNVNVYEIKHIPFLNNVLSEVRQIKKNGTPEQKAILRGQMAIGTALMATGTYLSQQGILTGFGPSDPGEKRIWLQTHQPLSIKVGEDDEGRPIWVSYKSIPVANLLFPMIADTGMVLHNLDDYTQAEILRQGVYTLVSTASNRSYFTGLVELSALLDFESRSLGPDVLQLALDRFAAQPGNIGLRKSLEREHGEGIFQYRSNLDAIVGSLTGGLMGERIPMTDILNGDQMTKGTEHPINFINPFRVFKGTNDKVIRQFGLLRYHVPTQYVEKIDGLDLTTEQSELMRQRMYNKGKLREDLLALLTSDDFQSKYDNWQTNIGTDLSVPRNKSEWWNDIDDLFMQARNNALEDLESDTSAVGDDFRRRMAEHKALRNSAASGTRTAEMQSNRTEMVKELEKFSRQQ